MTALVAVLAGAAVAVALAPRPVPARLAPAARPAPGTGASPSPARRRWRVAAAAVAVAVLAGPVPGVLVLATHLLLRRLRSLRRAARAARPAGPHLDAVAADLPELVDLLALGIGAGLTLPATIAVVARSAPPSVADALARVDAAVAAGAGLEPAVASLTEPLGEAGRPLVRALVDHLRYGTPLLPSLERVRTEARAHRRRAAEARARRLPVLLLFPLVLCTLPAFGLLTVAPLVAGTLGALDVGPLEAPASPAP